MPETIETERTYILTVQKNKLEDILVLFSGGIHFSNLDDVVSPADGLMITIGLDQWTKMGEPQTLKVVVTNA